MPGGGGHQTSDQHKKTHFVYNHSKQIPDIFAVKQFNGFKEQ